MRVKAQIAFNAADCDKSGDLDRVCCYLPVILSVLGMHSIISYLLYRRSVILLFLQLEFKKYISKTAKGAHLDARALRATSKADFATADANNSRFIWLVNDIFLRMAVSRTKTYLTRSRVEFNEFFAYYKAHQDGATRA